MNGKRTFIASLLVASAAFGATADYFPLQVGNSWAYRVTQGRLSRPGTVNIERTERVEGREYYRVSFFEQSLLIRPSENGSLLKYDPEAKTEGVWLPFGAAEGAATRTEMDQCSRVATVSSTAAKIKIGLGEFDNALRIAYTPNCADAGVTEQYFLPYVGMVVHETTSIAGPVRHELVYSRTGATNVVAQTNAFTLATDAPTYKAGEQNEMLARVTLRVSQPVMLTFPSSQNTDLRITNDKGDIVYTWSMDKLFAQVFREERIEGERNWVMSVPIANLAPGKYTAEGWLTTSPRQYSAQVTFEITR